MARLRLHLTAGAQSVSYLFVGKIDEKLLKAVVVEALEAENVQDADLLVLQRQ